MDREPRTFQMDPLGPENPCGLCMRCGSVGRVEILKSAAGLKMLGKTCLRFTTPALDVELNVFRITTGTH